MDEIPEVGINAKGNDVQVASILLVILLATSVCINVLLARKTSSLQLEISRLTASTRLQVGAIVSPISGHALDGSVMELKFDEVQTPTVIYVFSPQCSWCAKNIDNFHSLIAQAANRYRVVGLSMTRQDLSPYLTSQQFGIPVFADVDSGIVSSYQLGATPTTIVVSPQSKVLKVWLGACQEGMRQEIEGFLGIHLQPCCNPEAKQS